MMVFFLKAGVVMEKESTKTQIIFRTQVTYNQKHRKSKLCMIYIWRKSQCYLSLSCARGFKCIISLENTDFAEVKLLAQRHTNPKWMSQKLSATFSDTKLRLIITVYYWLVKI